MSMVFCVYLARRVQRYIMLKAVVMAGGQGSRLRPLTVARPKPLLPLVNKPVIGHIIDWLKRYGIEDIIITLQHQAELFQDYLGRGASMGIRLRYVVEDVPLGTAGGVAFARSSGAIHSQETILVVSGDALTDVDLNSLLAFHHSRQADATVALHQVANPLEYGMVITEPDGRIVQFVEKPGWADVVNDQVNMGVYVLESSVLEQVPEREMYDFSQDLFPKLMAQGRGIYGFAPAGYWCDVGTPAAYLQATMDLLQNRVQHEPFGRFLGGDIWIKDNVEIAPDAELYGPIYLGDNVQIKGKVFIQGPAVIRDDTIVDNRVNISRSIFWRGCYIGEDTNVQGAIISKQCVLKPKVQVQEGAVIGDRCVLGEGAVIYANVKLWPSKEIDAGAEIRDSIVWGSQGRRVLFGRFGVTGVVNVDLTPEFAAKLGVAFGASLPKGSTVNINRDTHPSSRMIKRAIISGLPAAGINVEDLRTQPVPILRYFTRVSEAVAGVHVRISPHDRRVVDIRFMNAEGLNLGRVREREVERLFFREDFRRAHLDDIGTIQYALEVEDRYSERFLDLLDRECIHNAGFNVAVDYAHSTTIDILEPLLARLNVDVVGLNTRLEPKLLSILIEDWNEGMETLAKMVQAMGLKLGARVDVSGEQVFFVDGAGRRVDNVAAAAAMTDLVLREQPGGVIAVPVDRPTIFEKIAGRYDGRVIRTKVDIQDLMTMAAEQQVALAVNGGGYFIFPEFQPVPDGMFALARMLQYLAHHQMSLNEVLEGLPDYHWMHETVACPWEEKGRVMRLVNEKAKSYTSNTIDGVKFYLDADRWVLIRSDPDRALLHIYTETPSGEDTTALGKEMVSWLQEILAKE